MASLLQDMDIESHTNVGGTYVPHRITIQDILNSNRRKYQDAELEPPPKAPPAPRIGLLHKTVTRSSIVKWIFPARIRHADFNDLVFIGEDFFCVKEIMPDGRLRHVGTKADFPSKIRAAGVVGKRVEVEQPSLKEGVAPSKLERFSPSAGGNYNRLIPPNLVVLALEDCEVMFLFADQEEKNGSLHFYESLIPFPRQNTMTRQPGNQISVDPQGRVIAISAYSQTLMLCKLKEWRTLNDEFIANKSNWCPIIQELPVFIDGSIMKLTFLNTGDKAENNWILVVLARLKDRTRLYCYEGNVATGLTQINAVVSEHPLDKRWSHPELIIPYNHSPRFLLVSGTRLVQFDNVLTQHPTVTESDINPDGLNWPPRYPGSSDRFPIFTAWVHATRSSKFAEEEREELYLLREDGILYGVTAEQRFGGTSGMSGFRQVTKFNCSGSSAMASLLLTQSLMDPDTLVVWGDMSDGEMVSIGYPRNFPKSEDIDRVDFMKPHLLQIFPNWSPILDLAIVRPREFSRPSRNLPSIFVTSGRQPHGFVTELRLGHEASVKLECRVDEIVNAATGLWAVADASLEGRVFFIAFPDHTTVIRLMNDYEVILEPEESGTDQTEQTIVVMQTNEVIIQVTKRNIHVLEFDEANGTLHRSATMDLTALKVFAAAIEPTTPFVALAIQTESGPVLQTYLAQRVDGIAALRVVGDPIPIDDLPTSIAIFEHDQNFYTVVGGQTVSLFSLSRNFGLLKRYTFNPHEDTSSSQSVVIEDIIVLSNSFNTELLIVCGLRGGTIYTFNLNVERLEAKGLVVIRLGTGPVRLFADSSSICPIGFAVCGPEVCRLDYGDGSELGLSISSVWFNDEREPNFPQPSFPVLDILSTLMSKNSTSSEIVVYAESTLMIANVDGRKKTVPRKIPLALASPESNKDQPAAASTGTPHALLYSETLNAMVIALTEWSVKRGSKQGPSTLAWSGQRIWRGVIQFLPMAMGSRCEIDGKEGVDHARSTIIELSPGERILSMCEWHFSDGQSSKENILVGTAFTDSGTRAGRLYFLKASLDAEGRVHGKIMQIKSVDNPVKALAAYDKRRVVICDGNRLSMYGLDRVENGLKWNLHAKILLPDTARHVSVTIPYIYVTTVSKSFQAYRYCETPIEGVDSIPPPNFELVFGDGMARNTITHLAVQLPQPVPDDMNSSFTPVPSVDGGLIFLTDQSSNLTILHHTTAVAHNIGTRPLLHTTLPQTITRLALAPVRPPWLVKDVPGPISPTIIGTCTDGTLYAFTLITPEASLLLKFLENLVSWDAVGRLVRIKRDEGAMIVIDPERALWRHPTTPSRFSPASVSGATTAAGAAPAPAAGNYTIDADRLQRFVLPGGAGALAALLAQEAWEDDDEAARRVGNDVGARCLRFVELCEAVCGRRAGADAEGDNDGDAVMMGSDDDDDDESRQLHDAVRRCVVWLRAVAGEFM